MGGFSRQGANFARLGVLMALAMVLMPVGQPMPAASREDSMQAVSAASLSCTITSGMAFVEDDVEVEHAELTVVIIAHGRDLPRGKTGWLSSYLCTERLHRPPIA